MSIVDEESKIDPKVFGGLGKGWKWVTDLLGRPWLFPPLFPPFLLLSSPPIHSPFTLSLDDYHFPCLRRLLTDEMGQKMALKWYPLTEPSRLPSSRRPSSFRPIYLLRTSLLLLKGHRSKNFIRRWWKAREIQANCWSLQQNPHPTPFWSPISLQRSRWYAHSSHLHLYHTFLVTIDQLDRTIPCVFFGPIHPLLSPLPSVTWCSIMKHPLDYSSFGTCSKWN